MTGFAHQRAAIVAAGLLVAVLSACSSTGEIGSLVEGGELGAFELLRGFDDRDPTEPALAGWVTGKCEMESTFIDIARQHDITCATPPR
ncbi:hypothetical protein FB566_3496 [Stackebrandtia endophytica]|uniref:Uncharacterized protein n=1 Tax=Stackebrandtia endophytica TaxID=1496996 RepID=A0A543AZB1_9ACTN|nr:hypothetical protein [Stackebrandtia endophytica]TQL77922.1 hypothetical protein FB566_3496 [Stackebrandtia endophytica]